MPESATISKLDDRLEERGVEIYLAAPKGLDLCELGADGFGEDRGEGVADAAVDRGNSSSLRRDNWGVGGVELLAVSTETEHTSCQLVALKKQHKCHLRDVLLRDTGRLRQSLSSGGLGASRGGPISPRPRPNREEGGASGGPLGLNLPPIVQVSSVSASPDGGAFSRKPERLLKDGPPTSASGGGARGGARDERQSDALSDTDGGAGSRTDPGASNRLREESRDEERSGRGPSRLQFPENFSSSRPPGPPNPWRSLAMAEG